MRSARPRNTEDTQENEFLQPNRSLLMSNREPVERGEPVSKDTMIKNLEDRNQKLRAELIKIQEVLEEKPEEDKKEYRLIPIESSEQHMRKELQNAYKHIKGYEVEIRRLEDGQEGGLVTNRMQKLEVIYAEKARHIDKLKSQIATLVKSSNENAKRLKDNNLKDDLEHRLLTLNEEIKFLREKVKDSENRQKMKQANAKKQFEYIKKLEKVLIEQGVSADELEELRTKNTHRERAPELDVNRDSKEAKEGEVEDLTVDRYLDIKNELKLLRKMQGDYDKKVEQLSRERDEFQGKNMASRNKLVEVETEIEELQKQIKLLKSQVKPQNMRPMRSISTTETSKLNKIKRIGTSVQKSSKGTLTHILKYDEVGMTSDRGQRFTDRSVLGKHTNTKVVGVNVFINKATGLLCGIQSVYKVGDYRKPGGEYIRKDKDIKDPYYEMVSYECQENDFIKSLTGTLNPNDYLEYLNFITARGKTAKFGTLKTSNKQFIFEIAEEEMPVCMFGSLLIKSEPGKKDISVIEHFGYEIGHESNAIRLQPVQQSAQAGTDA